MKKEGCFTAQRYVKKKSKKSCDCLYVSFAELCRISPVYSDSDRLLYGAERNGMGFGKSDEVCWTGEL